jgi:hypothetical protein
MGLDPTLVYGYRPTPNVGPNLGTMLQDGSAIMQLQQAKQQTERQNALRGILSAPGAIDDQGNPTQDVMKQVYGVDPQAGMMLQQNSLVNTQRQLQTDMLRSKAFGDKMDLIGNAYAPLYQSYLDEKKNGAPDDQALAHLQDGVTEAYDRLKTSGALTPQEVQRLPTKADPIQLGRVVQFSDNYRQWQSNQAKAAKDARTEAREDRAEAETERYHREVAGEREEAGSQILDVTDAAGNKVQVNYNPKTRKATTLDGTPVSLEGSTITGKVGAGGANKTSGLTDEALDKAARYFHDTHFLPAGMGGQADKEAIMNREAKMYGPDADDAGRVSARKADQGAYQQLQKQADSASAYSKAAEKELDLVVKNLPKTWQPLNSTFLTKWVRTGDKQFGNKEVPVYQTYLISALDEYAKILSGGTGSTPVSDANRRQALDLIPEGATTEQVPAIVEALKAGIKNRTDGYADQISEIKKRMASRGDAATGTKTDTSTGGGATTPAKTDGGAAGGGAQLPRFGSSPADVEAIKKLPPGSRFIGADGKTYKTPQATQGDSIAPPAAPAAKTEAAAQAAPPPAASPAAADATKQALAAIARGAPPDQVMERMKAAGIDTSGVQSWQAAKDAIARGAPRSVVIERLKKAGIDTSGL